MAELITRYLRALNNLELAEESAKKLNRLEDIAGGSWWREIELRLLKKEVHDLSNSACTALWFLRFAVRKAPGDHAWLARKVDGAWRSARVMAIVY